MNLSALKVALRAQPSAITRIILPDGEPIPAHFHITEVGHVAKRFIDCGGTVHDTNETCLLQTYVAGDVEHRLEAESFAKILDLGHAVLPNDDLEVEVEYVCCVTAQYPLLEVRVSGEHLDLQLGERHTDCLAREKCGIEEGCGATAGCC
jgi:hypothetical protein